jgi:hypothetical protein
MYMRPTPGDASETNSSYQFKSASITDSEQLELKPIVEGSISLKKTHDDFALSEISLSNKKPQQIPLVRK